MYVYIYTTNKKKIINYPKNNKNVKQNLNFKQPIKNINVPKNSPPPKIRNINNNN